MKTTKKTVRLAKTVTHQASPKTKAAAKAKRTKKTTATADAVTAAAVNISVVFAAEEKSFPPVRMIPQTTPNGKTGAYCPVLVNGFKSRQVATGQKQEVEVTVEDQTTGEVKTKRVLKEVMRNIDKEALVPVWCRVIKGDERNGIGIVYLPNAAAPNTESGMKIRFAGGTRLTPAKMMERISVSG